MSPRAEKSGKSNLASPARHLRAANPRAEGGNGCSPNNVQRAPRVGGDSRKGTTHADVVAVGSENAGFPVGKFDVEVAFPDRECGMQPWERRVRISRLGTQRL